jgi:Ca-activated chloride channel family protein
MHPNEEKIGLRAKDSYADIGLVSAHVSGRLNGLVAQIKLRQVYKNWSDDNIECVYTFPLAWQSVLLGMRVELNGKSLTGSIKPKRVAEALYEKAIDNGDLPVMLERSGKDLYTANIGNIQTGDEVVIELDYAQILKAEDGSVRFSLPTTVAPRYGDSADSGMRPHQQSEADPQVEQRLFVNLEMSESLSAGTIHCPTHEIQHSRQGNQCSVRLEGAAWLDRDFVLVVDRLDDLSFAVAAPDHVRPGQATVLTGSVFKPQKAQQNRGSVIKVLVDCSGSMQGDSIEQARDCLNWLFGQLSNADKVSFSRFGSSVQHDHPALQSCSTVYRQVLKTSARRLAADLGGTEIDMALKEVIAIEGENPDETENAAILLITDGEVWNIDEIIATVRASGHRIYAVGVGSAPSESLLQDMAEVTGGACEMVTPRESMQRAVERLLIRLRQTQAIEQETICSAPVLWQSKTNKHAAYGEGLSSWIQVEANESDPNSLWVEQTIFPGDTRTRCKVDWDDSLDLSRISAAFQLHDISLAKEREKLAMEYQLVSSETNFILVHERMEAEKPEDLPELHQVKPMLAAGWGGNGTARPTRVAPSLQVMRSGVDNVIRSCESFNQSVSNMNTNTPAVWRSSRTHAAARVDGMANSGMDDIEIPAFLRKQADDSGPKTTAPVVQKFMDIVQQTEKFVRRKESTKTPQASPDEFMTILGHKSAKDNPVQVFLKSFNQAALSHTQFRAALATCLRTNQAGYLQWLVTKHMKAAGSGAPIWAVFISWAAEKFLVHLDRHAERLLRDFLKSVKPEVQATVRAELDALDQN